MVRSQLPAQSGWKIPPRKLHSRYSSVFRNASIEVLYIDI